MNKRAKYYPISEIAGFWMPAKLLLSNLKPQEKILVGILNSTAGAGCNNQFFASNKGLSKLLRVSITQVSTIISNLKRQGILEQKSFNGRLRVLAVNMDRVKEVVK